MSKLNYKSVVAKFWDAEAAGYLSDHPEHLDSTLHPSWGLWHIPESKLALLGDFAPHGAKLLDLGCGQGHDAVAFADLGFDVTAIDLSEQQIALAAPHAGVRYVHGSVEDLHFEPKSFDAIISDHGAFDHSPPRTLLKRCKSLLKANGIVIICTYTPLAHCCFSEKTQRLEAILAADYPADRVVSDGEMVSVQYSIAGWIKLFRSEGYAIERLEEIIAPDGVPPYFGRLVSQEWGRRWPVDLIWRVRLE